MYNRAYVNHTVSHKTAIVLVIRFQLYSKQPKRNSNRRWWIYRVHFSVIATIDNNFIHTSSHLPSQQNRFTLMWLNCLAYVFGGNVLAIAYFIKNDTVPGNKTMPLYTHKAFAMFYLHFYCHSCRLTEYQITARTPQPHSVSHSMVFSRVLLFNSACALCYYACIYII